MITATISGELWNALRYETTFTRDGESCWGYAPTPEADLEVERMVQEAVRIPRGKGSSYRMTGSAHAWIGLREYAQDRGEIERQGDGDFDRSLGSRLLKQAERIDAMLGQS